VTPASAQIVAAIRGWQTNAPPPLVVAIDGHGAAGKTTIAAAVSTALDAVIVHTDSYFGGTLETDDQRPMAHYYDWEALRREALQPAIDWLRSGPGIGSGPGLILVEGVSAAAPALADLVAHTVFVATPEPIRIERLHNRIADEEWDEGWLAAERVYFASRPPESFDLVVPGSTESAPGP
jgi:uridine kinase